MKLLALITDTFREIYAKKIIIGIVAIEVVALLITGFVLFSSASQEMYHEAATLVPPDTAGAAAENPFPVPDDTSLLGSDDAALLDSAAGDTSPRRGSSHAFGTAETGQPEMNQAQDELRPTLLQMVAGQLGAFSAVIALATLFIGIFTTAGIIPSMMEKGTIDLLISKPLPRATILFGRALGGFIAIAINLAVFVAAIWTLYGLATSVWHTPFLLWGTIIPLFTFIVLFSGVIVLNVLTESWVLPMSLAYVHLMILANFLAGREAILFEFITNEFLQGIITGLYYLLPQTADLIRTAPLAIMTGSAGPDGPFIQGGIFTVVMLAFAAWKFQRKDF